MSHEQDRLAEVEDIKDPPLYHCPMTHGQRFDRRQSKECRSCGRFSQLGAMNPLRQEEWRRIYDRVRCYGRAVVTL